MTVLATFPPALVRYLQKRQGKRRVERIGLTRPEIVAKVALKNGEMLRSLTPEQRTERQRKAWETRRAKETPEQLSARMKSISARGVEAQRAGRAAENHIEALSEITLSL